MAIPVISRSPIRDIAAYKSPGKLPIRSRIYDDKPLPVKPSDHAPRNARIVRRTIEGDRPEYTLDIGGVEVDEVGLDEILDYVSAYDLERFENEQFLEEREVMRIAKIEAAAERERRRELQKGRAKTKGTVIYQSTDDEGEDPNRVPTPGEGRHGRARPSYKHLYKPLPGQQLQEKKRRRRKRHPVTGELMPLSDHDSDVAPAATESSRSDDEQVSRTASARSPAPVAELPKRRRRKRDPVTGELLPLEPQPQPQPLSAAARVAASSTPDPTAGDKKRPRRRRHPQTGELMPLGWRYDPEKDNTTSGTPKGPSSGARAMGRLSISQEHVQKKVKLTSEASSGDDLSLGVPLVQSPGRRKLPSQTGHMQSPVPQPKTVTTVVELSDPESSEQPSTREASQAASASKAPQKTSMLNPVAAVSSRESSEEPITLDSFRKMSSRQADSDSESEIDDKKPATPMKTSITNPVASNSAAATAESGEEEELDEDEWFVESILGHSLSDPRTHPGKPRVMLYKVKWAGYDEPTWEPIASFGEDQSLVLAYRKHVGLEGPDR